MNAIFSVLILLLEMTSLLTQYEILEPEPDVNIPDEAFLNALIELGVDRNGDGSISPSKAEEIPNLDVSERIISDITGIEAFINLERLICWKNQLTSLDVSNNTFLTNISLNNMPSLKKVYVWETPFPAGGIEIDIEGSPNLSFTTECSK